MLIAQIAVVPTPACHTNPLAASAPTAAAHQRVAAVFIPRTLTPSEMITSAPRNPTPLTTYEVIRVGSRPDRYGVISEMSTNIAAPAATSVFSPKPGAAAAPLALEPDHGVAEHGGADAKRELVPGQHAHECSFTRERRL